MNRMISNSAKYGMGAAMLWMMRNNKAFRKSKLMKQMRKTGKRLKKKYL